MRFKCHIRVFHEKIFQLFSNRFDFFCRRKTWQIKKICFYFFHNLNFVIFCPQSFLRDWIKKKYFEKYFFRNITFNMLKNIIKLGFPDFLNQKCTKMTKNNQNIENCWILGCWDLVPEFSPFFMFFWTFQEIVKNNFLGFQTFSDFFSGRDFF